MMYKHLRAFVVALMLCASLVPQAEAKKKPTKADQLFNLGKAAEDKGDWDTALEYYVQADEAKPHDAAYIIAMDRARFQAGQKHVEKGQELRRQGKLQEALQEFAKAIVINPGSAIAIQEMKRTEEILKSPSNNPGDSGLTAAERVRKEEDERVASILGPPELKPVIRELQPFKMNNQQPRVLFETVGKLAGINVVFDSQYAPPTRGFNVELGSSSVEQAFDYLAVLTHTFWKPISSTSIFVTEDNVTKRRDYEDEVVKVFYVTNATSVQEFQEIATAIRTVAEIRRVFTYNAQKAMVVRGTVDQVALAEKLIHDLDKPKAEVVVDVIVMETNSTRTRDLAATITSNGTAGLNLGVTYVGPNTATVATGTGTGTGTTSTTPSGTIALSRIGSISTNQFVTTLPGLLFQAMLSDNRTKVLNSPQVRASDGQKVSLKIGDRIPYATGSFQPGVGTVGVSPLVSTQFNFAEVGVNVDITPQVHSNREISMHVEIEVSSVKQYLTIGGTGGLSQPVIGQRKNTADIRLREGEINILGGLSSAQDSSTVNGIPGLVDIPILGKSLFGSDHTEKDRQELMIVLIPHIVRTPDYSPENLRGIYAGTDQTVKLTYADRPDEPASTPPAPVAAPTPAGPPPAPVKPTPGVATAPLAPAQTAPQQTARIQMLPPVVQVSVSTPFTVTVQLEGASNVGSVSPLHIKYDPALLRLNDINAGEMFSRDGQRTTSVKDIRNDTGEATINISRLADAPGVSGAGTVATLSFVAVGKGTGTVSVTEAGFKDPKSAPQTVTLANVPVTIQ